MNDEEALGPIPVLLLWHHPIVASEFERALDPASFQLRHARIDQTTVERLEGLASREPSLVVVDVEPRDPHTDALVSAVLALRRGVRFIALADEFGEASAFSLLRLGAKGLLTYNEARERLARALREVAAGGFWVPRAVLSRFVDMALASAAPPRRTLGAVKLTPREHEILEDLLLNLSNKEIARKRLISGRTAKFHVSNVLAKYGVKRRADLLLLSLQEREPGAAPVH
jgi:DNA-binding NarL/FixJ family response regulator